MKNIFVIIILFSFLPITGKPQARNNMIGFKGGELNLINFIKEHMRYPAPAIDRGDNGIFFTVIFLNKKGELDSVSVLNGDQNKYFSSEIKRTIIQTKGQWEKSTIKRMIIIPIIFFINNSGKEKDGNYLIEITPGIENIITKKYSSLNGIFVGPVIIPGLGGDRR